MNNSLFLNLFDIVDTKNPKHASGFLKSLECGLLSI
jgi:hypothetical protein